MIKFFKKKFLIVVVLLAALILGAHGVSFDGQPPIWGVSFDVTAATRLGLDAPTVLKTIITDWNFKHLRLMAHWDLVEPQADQFDFAQLDWQMAMAEKLGAKVILAMGQKTPRWPECHAPIWAQSLNDARYFAALEKYLTAVTDRYRGNSALEIWQVENEPFLAFGVNCRALTSARLSEEIGAVKKADSNQHPVLVADSGELSMWWRSARAADLFGTTLYRDVWNQYIGYWHYNKIIPVLFYRVKLWLNRLPAERAYVLELQAEPWLKNNNPLTTPVAEQHTAFNLVNLNANINFVKRLGLPRVYLWGAEWWYWLGTQGDPAMIDVVTNLN